MLERSPGITACYWVSHTHLQSEYQVKNGLWPPWMHVRVPNSHQAQACSCHPQGGKHCRPQANYLHDYCLPWAWHDRMLTGHDPRASCWWVIYEVPENGARLSPLKSHLTNWLARWSIGLILSITADIASATPPCCDISLSPITSWPAANIG